MESLICHWDATIYRETSPCPNILPKYTSPFDARLLSVDVIKIQSKDRGKEPLFQSRSTPSRVRFFFHFFRRSQVAASGCYFGVGRSWRIRIESEESLNLYSHIYWSTQNSIQGSKRSKNPPPPLPAEGKIAGFRVGVFSARDVLRLIHLKLHLVGAGPSRDCSSFTPTLYRSPHLSQCNEL